MSFRAGRLRLFVGYELVAALTAVLILDRGDHYICCFSAAALHETGHLIMLRLFRTPLRGISLRLFDVRIDADRPSGFKAEAFVTLGGVMMNFLLAAIFVPMDAFFGYANLAMGSFNILPVESLDGGRLLSLILSLRFSDRVCVTALRIISFVIVFPLMTAGIYILFQSGYNYSLLMISLYLLAVLLLKK